MARSIVTLGSLLDAARVRVQDNAAQFGSPQVTAATTSFADRWRLEASRVQQHLADTADRLNEAADNYQQVEDAQLRAEGLAD